MKPPTSLDLIQPAITNTSIAIEILTNPRKELVKISP